VVSKAPAINEEIGHQDLQETGLPKDFGGKNPAYKPILAMLQIILIKTGRCPAAISIQILL